MDNLNATTVAQPQFQSNVTPGGFWIRFVAEFIDGIILMIAGAVFNIPFNIMVHGLNKEDPQNAALILVLSLLPTLLGLILGICYCGFFYSRKGATPGKMIFGLKVVMADSGQYISFGRSILRNQIGKTISALILGIGYFMAGFRVDKRALHDFISGTQVIRVRK